MSIAAERNFHIITAPAADCAVAAWNLPSASRLPFAEWQVRRRVVRHRKFD